MDDQGVEKVAQNLMRDGYVNDEADAMWAAMLILSAAASHGVQSDPVAVVSS